MALDDFQAPRNDWTGDYPAGLRQRGTTDGLGPRNHLVATVHRQRLRPTKLKFNAVVCRQELHCMIERRGLFAVRLPANIKCWIVYFCQEKRCVLALGYTRWAKWRGESRQILWCQPTCLLYEEKTQLQHRPRLIRLDSKSDPVKKACSTRKDRGGRLENRHVMACFAPARQ